MNKGSWGKVRAFFDLQTDEGFTIKGFKLVQGINGLFVGNPSQKGSDDEYYDTVYADKALKEELSQMAIDHYGQEVMPSEESFGGSSPSNDSFAEEAPKESSNVPTTSIYPSEHEPSHSIPAGT